MMHINNRSPELDAIMKAISIPSDKCAAAEEAVVKKTAKFQTNITKLPLKKTSDTDVKAQNNSTQFGVTKNVRPCLGKFGRIDDSIPHTDDNESIRQPKEGNAAHATQVAPS
jgi:hypothetical protein